MSKVGESIIQGAIETLEFAQGKGNDFVVHIPATIKLSESPELGSKTTEKLKIE